MSMVKLSKLCALVNIVLALVILYIVFTGIQTLYKEYIYQEIITLYVKGTFTPLIILSLLTITASILFLFKKRTGWWSTIIVTLFFIISCSFLLIYMLQDDLTSDNITYRILLILSISLLIFSLFVYLSTPVRRHFNISKNPD